MDELESADLGQLTKALATGLEGVASSIETTDPCGALYTLAEAVSDLAEAVRTTGIVLAAARLLSQPGSQTELAVVESAIKIDHFASDDQLLDEVRQRAVREFDAHRRAQRSAARKRKKSEADGPPPTPRRRRS